MIDARLSRVEDRLEGLEQRLAALESRLAPETDDRIRSRDSSPEANAIPAASPPQAAGPAASAPGISAGSVVSLLGRFLMILGGAFLLRAATEAGTVPPPVGVAAGLAYGILQLWLASRAAASGAKASANWFGLGGAVILLPLIAESTLKFRILGPGLASFLLAGLGFSGVAVAFRSHLRPMAWAFLGGAGSIGIFLAVKTGFGLGFPLGVVLVGLGGLWMGYLRHWYGLAIVGSVVPVALVAGVSLLVALEYSGAVVESLTPAVALVLQLLLVAGFLGSFLARALRWSAPVGLPEMMQAVTAMFIGVTGALVSAHKDPSLTAPFGIAMLVTGLGSYAVSFLRIDRREGHSRNFAFFSSVALAATLTGSALILSGPMVLLLFIGTALGLAFVGARRQRVTLSLHAAIYVVAAGFASGALQRALDALVGSAALPPTSADLLPMLAVLAVGAVCLGAPVAREGRTWGRLSRLPKAVYLLFLLVVIDGLIVAFATQRFAALPDGEFDAGLLAAFRTGLLSLGAVAIGFMSRWSRTRGGALLVPVVLVLGGFALALGDLRGGRAATQFSSMALYGMALIVAPRLARSGRAPGGSDTTDKSPTVP